MKRPGARAHAGAHHLNGCPGNGDGPLKRIPVCVRARVRARLGAYALARMHARVPGCASVRACVCACVCVGEGRAALDWLLGSELVAHSRQQPVRRRYCAAPGGPAPMRMRAPPVAKTAGRLQCSLGFPLKDAAPRAVGAHCVCAWHEVSWWGATLRVARCPLFVARCTAAAPVARLHQHEAARAVRVLRLARVEHCLANARCLPQWPHCRASARIAECIFRYLQRHERVC